MMPSFLELCVIGVVATVLFGHKFAGLGRAFGQCLGAFKEGLGEGHPGPDPLPSPPGYVERASDDALPKSLGYTPPESPGQDP